VRYVAMASKKCGLAISEKVLSINKIGRVAFLDVLCPVVAMSSFFSSNHKSFAFFLLRKGSITPQDTQQV
jgi:hypothetical protein